MDLATARASTKKWTIRIGIGATAALILGSVLYTYTTLHYAYSKGERVGFVQKVSKRGWVCQTNEGELAMVNMAGQQAEVFEFTVPDDATVKKMESFAGHRVVLTYEEHRGIPSRCFGETGYFVVDVNETK